MRHFNLAVSDDVPVALGVAPAGVTLPDLASAIVVADPIGSGFTMSQDALAKAIGTPGARAIGPGTRAEAHR